MRRIKGIENITCEEKFKELEWFSLEEKEKKAEERPINNPQPNRR